MKRPLIAIVDDDTSVCSALVRLLSTHGIRAETFVSGCEFLGLLETEPSFQPKCVVIDIQMPGRDGLALLRHLTETRPHLPVIVLTACSGEDVRNKASALDVVGFFLKPLHEDLAEFVDTLRAVLGLDDEAAVRL